MSRFILLFILFLECGKLFSQNVFSDLKNLQDRADYYYSRLSYVKAAELYHHALKKKKNKENYDLNIKAAGLFRKIAKFADAKVCYENILSSGKSLTKKDSIQYFNTLRALRDTKADTLFGAKYSRVVLNNLFRDSLFYNIYEIPFNTGRPEYSPVTLSGGLMFTAEDPDTSFVKRINGQNNAGFGQLYYSAKSDTGWSEPLRVSPEENNYIHTGPAAFAEDGSAIINVCREEGKGPFRLELFSSLFNEQTRTWTNFIPVELNNPEYSLVHPALSSDGKRLFFASDMPGGFGGTDIYSSEYKNGRWTKPKNLGKPINTPGDETYPYLSNENILFFSSDGRLGLGGMDIYYSDLLFNDTAVVNMGFPVNSNFDDFGFSYSIKDKTGYFSSNRKNVGMDDDLYMYTENKIFLEVNFYDNFDKKELTEYAVKILDVESGTRIRSSPGSQPNVIKVNLRPAHKYQLVFTKDDFRNDTLFVSTYGTDAKVNEISRSVYMKRKPIYFANLKYRNESTQSNFRGNLILVNNLTESVLDTLNHDNASAIIRLNGECDYIITSRSDNKLSYIYVGKKQFKITSSIPLYNLYLGSAIPSILHVRVTDCSNDKTNSLKPHIKIRDWVNRNEFNIDPGPEGDFQLVVTDSRLYDLYVDGKLLTTKSGQVRSDNYCLQFLP